jgi:hypothetical protein
VQPKVETFFPGRFSSLRNVQVNIQFFVREKMKEVDDKHFKMGAEGWDIIGQCTASLMTITAIVQQAVGDKYPTSCYTSCLVL